jgi:hypothetical protein
MSRELILVPKLRYEELIKQEANKKNEKTTTFKKDDTVPVTNVDTTDNFYDSWGRYRLKGNQSQEKYFPQSCPGNTSFSRGKFAFLRLGFDFYFVGITF